MEQLEFITWVDSYNNSSAAWFSPQNLIVHMQKVQSIGFLIKETDEVIFIASHVTRFIESQEVDQCLGEMVIPKVAILKRIIIAQDVLHGT